MNECKGCGSYPYASKCANCVWNPQYKDLKDNYEPVACEHEWEVGRRTIQTSPLPPLPSCLQVLGRDIEQRRLTIIEAINSLITWARAVEERLKEV
jgi:hypothetical protein